MISDKQFNYSGHEESKLMVQESLDAAVRNMSIKAVAVYTKCPDVDINRIIDDIGTTLDQILIRWVNGLYDGVITFLEFICCLNALINMGASFSDELDPTPKVGSPRDISSFTQPTDTEYAVKAYKRGNVIFINIRNARLKMGKLLESEFCRNNCLFNSHFNINGNKGYAQKNYSTGMRNYVIYRGCINMRASWSVVSSDKNSSKTIKKESINIYIKDNGTVSLSTQDELRYKKREINFNECRVLIGGHRLEDVLKEGRWLYSDNQFLYDSGYFSREASPERKISTFSSNNGDLLNSDTCQIDQENNKNSSVKDTDVEQTVDLSDSLSINTSDVNSVMSLIDEVSNNIAEIGKEKRVEKEDGKVKEEDEECLQESKPELIKGRKDNYKIACGISIDNSQMSLKCSDQNGNVDSSISGKYCEDMDIEVLATINNVSNSQDKVAEWLSNHSNNNNVRSRKDSSNTTTSNTTPSLCEPDRSSTNGLSWDNELDYNPPRRTRSFNSKHRSSSVPTRLGTLREALDNSQNCNLNESFARSTIAVTYPKAKHSISSELDTPCEALDNNPSYNLNKSCICSIVQDPNESIIKLGIYNIQRPFG